MNAHPHFHPATIAPTLLRGAVARLRGGVARRLLGAVALLVVLGGIAGVALLAQGSGPSQTAFAHAPSGQYAVVARSLGAATAVEVVGATADDAAMEIALVPHLAGFNVRGTVSPDGRAVALIVPNSGIPTQPLASLITLDLETGRLRVLAEELDPLQDALWTPDSQALVVTNAVQGAVAVARVGLDGGVTALETHAGAVAVAPVGFDTDGSLVAVRLDGEGSTLTRDGQRVRRLSPYFTRDWTRSPDGMQLAFVEVNLADGLRYLPQVAWIGEGSSGSVSAAAAGAWGQALGTAWTPSGRARFGREPYTPPGSVSAQSASGFDVPLSYSRDGSALAVRRWSGASFEAPGTSQLEIVRGTERQTLTGYTRFFGWSAR